MLKFILLFFLFFQVVYSQHSFALTPTFFVNKQINFGILMLAQGSCYMEPDSSTLLAFQGLEQ